MNSDVQSFVCKKVWEDGAPILHVCHELDGTWQFLCDGDEHNTSDAAVLIHARHIFDLHPELVDIADLELGYYAWRSADTQRWKIYKEEIDD